MIRVTNLSKRYAGHLAVDDVSFEVKRGEIVGFLGPNGAGKTTTMRMLTGYLAPSTGEIRIGGRDVFKESIEVRKSIGYLPENCPLYPEMRVDEYLMFRARLKQVPKTKRADRREEVKSQCGLESVGQRIIGQLSKGYRQRVGLAECMIHDPDLLILDEPTIGLDPNQIRQVRDMIRNLAQRHTILLSTHILPEVEMTCERVLIINHGRIIASDAPKNLSQRLEGSTQIVAEIQGPRDQVLQALTQLDGVNHVTAEGGSPWDVYRLECVADPDLRPMVCECAVHHQWRLRELRLEKKNLEDVFVALTHGHQEARDS